MFDRDIFKVLIGEIADTREVEIGCDECYEQLDRFVEMKLRRPRCRPGHAARPGTCGDLRRVPRGVRGSAGSPAGDRRSVMGELIA